MRMFAQLFAPALSAYADSYTPLWLQLSAELEERMRRLVQAQKEDAAESHEILVSVNWV
jgi:hypothetical protein